MSVLATFILLITLVAAIIPHLNTIKTEEEKKQVSTFINTNIKKY